MGRQHAWKGVNGPLREAEVISRENTEKWGQKWKLKEAGLGGWWEETMQDRETSMGKGKNAQTRETR